MEQYLNAPLQELSVAGAWFGVLLYSIQLYYDFSAYSDMAIGLGRMFGFHYHTNFNYPYLAKSVTDFWRRWHISLGASWNFVLWGAFYGILLMVEKLGLLRWLQRIPVVFSHLYLLFVTLIGWTLFYTTDLSRLAGYFQVMFGGSGNPLTDPQLSITFANHLFWLLAALLFCLPLTQWCKNRLESWVVQDGRGQGRQALVSIGTAMMNVALLLVCTALLVGDSYNPFLYFRF